MNKHDEQKVNLTREEKINRLLDYLNENNIKIIEIEKIGEVIIDEEFNVIQNKEYCNFEHIELTEIGLSGSDIDELGRFLDSSGLMMIREDDITGVSFENCEYYLDKLFDSTLWIDEENFLWDGDNEEDEEREA